MVIVKINIAVGLLCFLSASLYAQNDFNYKWGLQHSGSGQERAGIVDYRNKNAG